MNQEESESIERSEESAAKIEVKNKAKYDSDLAKTAKIRPVNVPKAEEEHDEQIDNAFGSEPVDLTNFESPEASSSAVPSAGARRAQGPTTPAKEPAETSEDNPFVDTGGPEDSKKDEDEKDKDKDEDKDKEDAEQAEKKKKEEGEGKPKEGEGEGGPGAAEGEAAEGEPLASEAGAAEGAEGAEAATAGAEGAEAAGAGEVAGAAGAGEAAGAGAAAGAEGAAAAGAGEAAAGAAAAGAEAAAAAGAETAAAAGAAATSEFWIPCIIIGIIVLILLLVLGSVGAYALSGHLGKTSVVQSGKDSNDVQKLISSTSEESRVRGYNRAWVDPKDAQYLKDGVIDIRLVQAFDYLVSKHQRIVVSHLLAGYEELGNGPATESNDQLYKNISAHHSGLGGDISEIDFVYKVFEENKTCSAATNGLVGDIVYYNDKNDELLRFTCRGDLFDTAKSNTIWNNKPAEGIPIKIVYQDAKPDNPHAGTIADPAIGLSGDDLTVYKQVLQPEARRKVHQVISELLAWPATTDSPRTYRVTQLITYSQERDVDPFEKDGTLDKVYGKFRPENYGLFAMEEAWQNIHIGY